ncbi:type II secretion system GspH family protein [Limnobacter humi]|uniref:Type II secretion system GspH family protein n=1 Tax=Limnobacter humi TaxID=1778671 RepID=A0ABT1WIU8_9BURK|nr:type II secretion system protein [Limnobacter humi]MCQ8897446.1 type II secretion system GspH family protein [Limnobacter humi]
MDGHRQHRLNARSGFTLLETALVLMIVGLLLGPLIKLVANQQASELELKRQQAQRGLQEALEAFVLTHGRLPCPADQADGWEARQGGTCLQATGWFPSQSLGLPKPYRLRMALADLASATAPAAGVLLRAHPFELLSPQQLSEIVFNPPTANLAVGQGPLPALHLCHRTGASPPPVQAWGCGNLPTLSESAVLVALAEQDLALADNGQRGHQFILDIAGSSSNRVWLSYDRLFWLWLQGGWLSGGAPAPTASTQTH